MQEVLNDMGRNSVDFFTELMEAFHHVRHCQLAVQCYSSYVLRYTYIWCPEMNMTDFNSYNSKLVIVNKLITKVVHCNDKAK